MKSEESVRKTERLILVTSFSEIPPIAEINNVMAMRTMASLLEHHKNICRKKNDPMTLAEELDRVSADTK